VTVCSEVLAWHDNKSFSEERHSYLITGRAALSSCGSLGLTGLHSTAGRVQYSRPGRQATIAIARFWIV